MTTDRKRSAVSVGAVVVTLGCLAVPDLRPLAPLAGVLGMSWVHRLDAAEDAPLADERWRLRFQGVAVVLALLPLVLNGFK